MHQIVSVVGTPPSKWLEGIKNIRNWQEWKEEPKLKDQFKNIDPRLLELIQGMLEIVPEKRISSHKILTHKFFEQKQEEVPQSKMNTKSVNEIPEEKQRDGLRRNS